MYILFCYYNIHGLSLSSSVDCLCGICTATVCIKRGAILGTGYKPLRKKPRQSDPLCRNRDAFFALSVQPVVVCICADDTSGTASCRVQISPYMRVDWHPPRRINGSFCRHLKRHAPARQHPAGALRLYFFRAFRFQKQEAGCSGTK